jgi:hypothetical protein
MPKLRARYGSVKKLASQLQPGESYLVRDRREAETLQAVLKRMQRASTVTMSRDVATWGLYVVTVAPASPATA